ncbi:hypothetical protein N7492_007686 [Penicillium capsulatum]|uniref:dipeptidyl-peptidase IV n=1 Tax=Penicillium capsulatum TaxID=69766 RepID=A0A9W9I1Q2_9EURO|nr:hypothetical protein N7492_007686 [Penicillium capsulatum]KAJ6117520.1 hypothetical protein N7512_007245 [Penicillium capsulatum]
MGKLDDEGVPEAVPLTQRERSNSIASHASSDSGLSVASAAFLAAHKEELTGDGLGAEQPYRDVEDAGEDAGDDEPFLAPRKKPTTGNRFKRVVWLLILLCIGGWALAFVLFLTQKGSSSSSTAHSSTAAPFDDPALGSTSSRTPVTLEQVLTGAWSARSHGISWIAGPNGEDGLLVERGNSDHEAYLRVEDVRNRKSKGKYETRVLMKKGHVWVGKDFVIPMKTWPSPDLKKVLIASNVEKNWRHSYYARYWILDVATQQAEPLDPANLNARVQLATWSHQSDAVAFVRDNNVYLRHLDSNSTTLLTKDGGKDLFYGVPDWVYEEEVFAGNKGTWWSLDGKHLAFLRTNESSVPDYPVQFFLSNPSGKKPAAGLENYPEVQQIKYPKSGSPNPIVTLSFYDVEKRDVFSIPMPDDFADDDRIIIEIVWASEGRVLIRETNRESDVLKVFLVDIKTRKSQLVRSEDIASLDGGWVEPSQSTRFIPADPENGRPHDGYVDTIPHDGYDHLGYFAPLDNPEPVILTQGKWEVVSAPSAVDLKRNLVYFVSTKEAPTQRHVYQVQLDGSDLRPVTDVSKPGYFHISFSDGAGYGLLSSQGPEVPWQSIINTQGDKMEEELLIEDNLKLTEMTKKFALPTEIYSNVTVDGYTLQVVERRPPNFNPSKKYPVLFYLYGGPGSQTVDRKFTVDFQSYVASSLGYIVVTVDGRGTGYTGRQARCIVRGKLGQYETHDQIETAKIWAEKNYVDETRLAIWGWSFGGFMTLKVLEQDAGHTFRYGMAVAPVTDWRYYDSIYTERYMHTPDHNPSGYDNATISDAAALGANTRFLLMHGVADDNVHFQNSLVLIDKLDIANIDNYDMAVFPDSDHSIAFHNGHRVVYERLSSWLINAFNGEWNHIPHPKPKGSASKMLKRALSFLP